VIRERKTAAPITLEIRYVSARRSRRRTYVRCPAGNCTCKSYFLFSFPLRHERSRPVCGASFAVIYEGASAFEWERSVPANRRFNPRLRPRKEIAPNSTRGKSFIFADANSTNRAREREREREREIDAERKDRTYAEEYTQR